MGLLQPKKRNPKILICKHRLIARLSGSLRRGVCSCLLFFSQLLSTFSVVSLFQMNEMFMYFSKKKKNEKKNVKILVRKILLIAIELSLKSEQHIAFLVAGISIVLDFNQVSKSKHKHRTFLCYSTGSSIGQMLLHC